MPRSQNSAAAMAVGRGGGVERRRRLQGQRVARIEGPDGPERVAQQRVDEGEPLLGDGQAGYADAVTHLVQGEFGGRCAHGETSVVWSSEDSTRPARVAQGAWRHTRHTPLARTPEIRHI